MTLNPQQNPTLHVARSFVRVAYGLHKRPGLVKSGVRALQGVVVWVS